MAAAKLEPPKESSEPAIEPTKPEPEAEVHKEREQERDHEREREREREHERGTEWEWEGEREHRSREHDRGRDALREAYQSAHREVKDRYASSSSRSDRERRSDEYDDYDSHRSKRARPSYGYQDMAVAAEAATNGSYGAPNNAPSNTYAPQYAPPGHQERLQPMFVPPPRTHTPTAQHTLLCCVALPPAAADLCVPFLSCSLFETGVCTLGCCRSR